MDALLQSSPNVGVEELFESIGRDPKFLDIDKDAVFVDTPLHKAVSCKNAELALQILRLMPSQGRKLNSEGYSPLHIALRGEDVDLVRRLIKLDPELIRVPGREGMTPLHYAAEQNKEELVAEFLLYCPDAIEDVTIRRETALHVAQKNESLKALRVLYGWVEWKGRKEVLELRDWEGKRVLRPAPKTQTQTQTETDRTEVTEWGPRRILSLPERKPSSRSKDGNFVYYLCSSSPRTHSPAWWLYARNRYKLDSETRNAILVVAVLIATATFQAVLSPPGGFSAGNPIINSNTSTMSNANIIVNENKDGHLMMSRNDFTVFAVVNSMAFALSLAVILIVLPLQWSNTFLYLSSVFFLVTYILAIKITSPDQKIIITIAVLLPYITIGYGFIGSSEDEDADAKDETYWKRIVDDTYNPSRNEDEVEVVVQGIEQNLERATMLGAKKMGGAIAKWLKFKEINEARAALS